MAVVTSSFPLNFHTKVIEIKHGHNFELYRDDGLGIVKATPRQTENIKKDLCKIFAHQGLKMTINANKKAVNFLDVTLNLNDHSYRPYTKPNSRTLCAQRIEPSSTNYWQYTTIDK
jgi:hypothetical protein